MAHKLADELLQMILSPSLTIPHDKLVSSHPTTFGRNDIISSASALLVCKRWLRVATPLLYETVVIRSTGQAHALADAFRLNPMFSKHVRTIRLEGAYGALDEVFAKCTMLSTLVIFFRIYSDAKVTSLCRAFSRIDPKDLILYDHLQVDNAQIRKTLNALFEAIPKWKNLTTLSFPYGSYSPQGNLRLEPNSTRRQRLIDSVCKSKSLRVISCDLPHGTIDYWKPLWGPLTRNPSITIAFKYRSDLPQVLDQKERVLAEILNDKQALKSTFDFVDHSESAFSPPAMSEKQDKIVPPSSFKSASVPSDVWSLIFSFAATPDSPDDLKWMLFHDPGQIYNEARQKLSLVCKLFAELVMPFFLTAPLLMSAKALHLFTKKVLQDPTLGSRVHIFYLSTVGHDSQETVANDLCSLIPHLISVRHFIASRTMMCVDMTCANVFALLAKVAGGSLLSVTLDFSASQPAMSPTILNAFTKLTSLNIKSPPPVTEDKTGLQIDSLSTLRELRLDGPSEFLSTLSVLRMPQLRKAVFTRTAQKDFIEKFMETCGAHVEELDFTGITNFANLFRQAPSLRTLKWEPTSYPWHKLPEIFSSALSRSASHEKLQTLLVSEVPHSRSSEKEQFNSVGAFFNFFNIGNFPSLKEIRFIHYFWPVEERAILRDPLPTIAIQVKDKYDVDIKDRSGKPWRRRVQKRR